MIAFWELCMDGQINQVRAEIARGGDVNDKDSTFGTTALMWAVIKGHNSIVKLLLEQPRVKTNEKNNMWSRTALHYAAWNNNTEGARMVLLHKDFNSANVTDNFGFTALMIAVKNRKEEVLRELVKHQCVSLDVGRFEMYEG